MYTICKNHPHNESVYSLIQPPEILTIKPPMYRSRYSKSASAKGESCCQTSKCCPRMPRASMSQSTNQPQKPICENPKKDFVKDNALKVIRQPPKVPHSFYVDHPRGDRFEWRSSGFPRKYVCREDFGMIPGYLVERKRELYEADQKAKEESEQADAKSRSKCRHLEETERQTVLCGLKANWAETFQEFQSLPLLIDTPGLVKKKYDLETALKDLEKDIQFIERHNHIFVSDTDKTFYLT